MDNQHACRSVAILGLLLLALLFWAPVGKAERQFQTVPTMPPASSTPSITPYRTPTHPAQLTATLLHPSATSLAPTQIALTLTAVYTVAQTSSATQTPAAPLASPTSFPPGQSVTPSPGAVSASTQFLPSTLESLPTSAPSLPGQQGSELGLVGLVGGGLVLLLLLVAAGIALIRRKQRSKDHQD